MKELRETALLCGGDEQRALCSWAANDSRVPKNVVRNSQTREGRSRQAQKQKYRGVTQRGPCRKTKSSLELADWQREGREDAGPEWQGLATKPRISSPDIQMFLKDLKQRSNKDRSSLNIDHSG